MIESSIMKKPGVIQASVALSTCKGKFTYNPEVTGPRAIIEAIKVTCTSSRESNSHSGTDFLKSFYIPVMPGRMKCIVYFDIDAIFVQSLGYQAELYTDDDKDAARYDHRDEIKR